VLLEGLGIHGLDGAPGAAEPHDVAAEVGVAHRRRDPGAGQGAELHGRRPHPAGGPVHQEVLAHGEAALGEQGVVRRGEHLGEAPGLGPLEAGRHRHQAPLVDGAALGLAATAHHAHHLVAHGEPAGAGADGLDLAGQLEAGHVGRGPWRRRVEAPGLQEVGPVQAGRLDPDHDLARARYRVGALPHLDPPVPCADDGEHQATLTASLGTVPL